MEPRQFAAKQRVVREVSLQPHEQLASARQFFLADIGDSQQDAREGSEQIFPVFPMEIEHKSVSSGKLLDG